MDKKRALLALQRRQQQPEVEVIHPQRVIHPRSEKRIIVPRFDSDTIAIAAVLLSAVIGITIIGSLFGLRGIIYEMRRNPDVSTCLFDCHD